MSVSRADTLPRLSREFVASAVLTDAVASPGFEPFELPERAVQFGTGAFLRGFIECFLDEANRRGDFDGRVVAIGSTGGARDVAINEQDGLYTVCVDTVDGDNAPRRECRVIGSLSRALSAQRDWEEVLTLARSAILELVFSNTTEIGIRLDASDRLDASPPPSFPGKLTRFLLERARTFDFSDAAGLVVLPCELIERNGDRLRELVLDLARRWRVEPPFAEWITRAVPFCNTLVDRIVPGRPPADARRALEQSLGYRDELMISAEPYRLFAIEAPRAVGRRLRFAAADPTIVVTDDVGPYRERKLRILNGAHTLLASVGLLNGDATVAEALRHAAVGAYLRRVLFDEIVPSLTVPNGVAFATQVLARFANPMLSHALSDIVVQHTAKMRVRVVPSIVAYGEHKATAPPSLAFGFAAYVSLLGGFPGGEPGADAEGERVRARWRDAEGTGDTALRPLVERICADRVLWDTDLSVVPGFIESVAEDLMWIARLGMRAALERHLESLPARGSARWREREGSGG